MSDMSEDSFTPEVATGPFGMHSHIFCSAGSIADPGVLWFDACHPGQPPLGIMDSYVRAMKASLPFGSEEIGQACEALFGPPVPKDVRGFPHGADWVLTTPMDGVFLIVRLPDHKTDRFGFGIEVGLMDRICNMDRGNDREARDAAEKEVQDALLVTLRAIRAEMTSTPAPAP